MRHEGRAYVVTGGGSGIGRATAERLSKEGGRVVVWDIRPDAAKDTADAIGGIALTCDVTDAGSVRDAAAATPETTEALHGLVNAAGILLTEGGVEAASLEDWNRVIATNLTSMFLTGKYPTPSIRTSTNPAIVNIASIYGLRDFPMSAPTTHRRGASST